MNISEILKNDYLSSSHTKEIIQKVSSLELDSDKTIEEKFILASLKLILFLNWPRPEIIALKYVNDAKREFNSLKAYENLYEKYYQLFTNGLSSEDLLSIQFSELFNSTVKKAFCFIFFLSIDELKILGAKTNKLIEANCNAQWPRYIRGTIFFIGKNNTHSLIDYLSIDRLINYSSPLGLGLLSNHRGSLLLYENNLLHQKYIPGAIHNSYLQKCIPLLESDLKSIKLICYNHNTVLNFGKHKNKTVIDVIENYPEYILWCILNLDHFIISTNCVLAINPNTNKFNDAISFNMAKLEILSKKESIELELAIEEEQSENDFDSGEAYFNDFLDGDYDNEWNID